MSSGSQTGEQEPSPAPSPVSRTRSGSEERQDATDRPADTGRNGSENADSEGEHGLAIGGADAASVERSADGTPVSETDSEDEDDDEEEDEEPPELRAATEQQDFPPTPYEECLDMKMFEIQTEPSGTTDKAGEPSGQEQSPAATADVPDDEGTSFGDIQEIVPCNLEEKETTETLPAEKDKLHVSESPSDVGERQLSSPSNEDPDSATCFGVRRKSELPPDGGGTASRVEQPVVNGTKKKVRPNRLSPTTPASRSSGYRGRKNHFWLGPEAVDTKQLAGPGELCFGANAESPTKLHRPLERSWPPKTTGGHRQRQRQRQGAGEFSFDIIDTDEQEQVEGAVGGMYDYESQVPNLVPGEVANDEQVEGSSDQRQPGRLDSNGNDAPESGNDGTMPSAGSATPAISKMPLRKAVKNVISSEGGGLELPGLEAIGGDASLDLDPAGDLPAPSVRPHRPLTRTLSNGRSSDYGCTARPLIVDYNSTLQLLAGAGEPDPNSNLTPSATTGGSFREQSPAGASRPQPRPLTRVGGPRMAALDLLVCPPTPTHHARRLRAAAAAASASGATATTLLDEFGPPELRTNRMPDQMLAASLVIAHPPASEDGPDESGASRSADSVVRHVPSIRLPSIPERARAILAEQDVEPLPPAWEARMDSHGRIFYIDHATRTTSWQRPGPGHASTSATALPHGSDPHRQQLDRRYQSIRRTIYEHMQRHDGNGVPSNPRPRTSSTSGRSNSIGTASGSSSSGAFHPALLMICRSDFYSMLHTNGEAIAIYNRNAALKHMVSRVRRDPGCFGRYQHNRDLVALVNCFAATGADLPTGWETKLDQSGKQFFIDHVNRKTSFMDPRLPTEGPRGRHHQAAAPAVLVAGAFVDDRPVPPPRPPTTISRLANIGSPEIPVAYNDKVVAFLRQPNILEILRERHGSAACSRNLREKINAIRVEGTTALDRYSHDLELTILLSLFEDEVMTYVPPRARSPPDQSSPSLGGVGGGVGGGGGGGRHVQRAPPLVRRDFEAKLRTFYRKLEAKGFGQGPHKLKVQVRRAHLVNDAFERIMAASRRDLQRGRLNVVWDTEEGLDYGGPSREFFYLLSRQLFNPYRNMYEYSANDIYTVQIAPAKDNEDKLPWYRFSGRVLGLALIHHCLLDAFFTRPFYKALLRLPVSLSDLESLDSSFHQSLLWIRDNDMGNGSELGLHFIVTEERPDGTSLDIELKPNGRSIPVTERNKRDYLERIIKWRLERGVLEQTEWLLRGFYEVVDHRLVSMFDASELELVISGTVEIDVADWRNNTEYRGGYHDTHVVIVWFWDVIERFSNEQRLRLLQFVTGTSSIPHDGFAGLRGSNGLRRFCIEKWGKPNALPRAHTCFNRLDLPLYPTPDVLYEKLVLAVEETNTFGIE
ncbi:E3 ubiquitin-protein ligase HECW2-like [Anopheles coustani]|uniref:E3 ubiquitin-protein ligase HECW2-like n=1 Tax=Anopheles coustani TaxID=139045 RepID=UPI00265AB782|nr:E3 ubiquitin-protein ligase HECW2-like [Anopheles coustani]